MTADVVVADGVLNLRRDEPKGLAETFRALRSGGSLVMTDIVLEEHVTRDEGARLGAWSD